MKLWRVTLVATLGLAGCGGSSNGTALADNSGAGLNNLQLGPDLANSGLLDQQLGTGLANAGLLDPQLGGDSTAAASRDLGTMRSGIAQGQEPTAAAAGALSNRFDTLRRRNPSDTTAQVGFAMTHVSAGAKQLQEGLGLTDDDLAGAQGLAAQPAQILRVTGQFANPLNAIVTGATRPSAMIRVTVLPLAVRPEPYLASGRATIGGVELCDLVLALGDDLTTVLADAATALETATGDSSFSWTLNYTDSDGVEQALTLTASEVSALLAAVEVLEASNESLGVYDTCAESSGRQLQGLITDAEWRMGC